MLTVTLSDHYYESRKWFTGLPGMWPQSFRRLGLEAVLRPIKALVSSRTDCQTHRSRSIDVSVSDSSASCTCLCNTIGPRCRLYNRIITQQQVNPGRIPNSGTKVKGQGHMIKKLQNQFLVQKLCRREFALRMGIEFCI